MPRARNHLCNCLWSFLVDMFDGFLTQQIFEVYLDFCNFSFPLILCSLPSNNREDGKESCAVLLGGVQGAEEENKRKRKMLGYEVWQV